MVSETPTDLSVLLPLGTRDKFADLLADIEGVVAEKNNQLKIRGFGISMTSLEDVFLRITQDDIAPSHYSSLGANSINNISNNDNNKNNDIKVKMKSTQGSMTQPLLAGRHRAPNWKRHFSVLSQMKVDLLEISLNFLLDPLCTP